MGKQAAASVGSTSSAKEGKKWFRVSKNSVLYKVVSSINSRDHAVKVKESASKTLIHMGHPCRFWDVHLYKLVGGTRYKFIVEYEEKKYCELKLKSKNGKKFELVSVKADVNYPAEFNPDGGGGFDSSGVTRFGGAMDGKLKAMAMMVDTSKGSKKEATRKTREAKSRVKKRPPKKMASGHMLYSAAGTPLMETRKYDPTASRVHTDGKVKNYITLDMRNDIKTQYTRLAKNYGMDGLVPGENVMEIFKNVKFKLTDPQRARLAEFVRHDKDQYIELNQLFDIMNRCFKEAEEGHFHMTVKELQDLFFQQDTDFSGMLDSSEVSKILNKVHLVTDVNQIQKYMQQMDKDGDGQMDFEEFMTLCQLIYKDRGGVVVANRSGPAAFNQTRGIIDNLRDKVERHHLMITHLKAQVSNFDEQLEIMDTIAAHSALQQELNKTREEKRRLGKLAHEMTQQHRGWMRDIKTIHAREKRDVMEKINFIETQKEEGGQAYNFVSEAYDKDFDEAMSEVAEIMQSLGELRDFCERSRSNVALDAQHTMELTRLAKDRLRKYKTGEEGTVYSPVVYNSSQAVIEFMKNKTSALEEWLIKRTQFTQSDREKYLKRVEDVKKKREEYDANKIALEKQLVDTEKKITSIDKKYADAITKNAAIREKLDDPTQRKHDEATEKALQDELEQIQEDIAQGHRDKLEWSKKLYPMEHAMNLERAKVSLLQVELGELKVLLEDVHHHEDVEIRTVGLFD